MADAIYEPPIKVIIDASITTNEEQNGHQAELASPPPPPPPPSILTRLHAGYFIISLSLGAQALLWKTLSVHTADSQALQHILRMVPSTAFLLVWWIALCTLILLSLLYFMRCIFHFHLVKSEFLHPVGVNYLFAPWISWLLLLQSAPSNVHNTVSYPILWWIFVLPVIILDVKIYGQWFTTEKQFLSMVTNPTSQLSVVGNLVGAWAAAQMGWKESSVCIFTLGTTHYLVVFITLYQRLSGSSRIPATLRPVFFLFVAAPSMASLAWKYISGTFDTLCKMLFFLSLFLFISLACRPALFKKSMKQFDVGWWTYSFPLTFLALASAEYASQVKGIIAPGLMLLLSGLSVLMFLCLMVFTAFNSETLLIKNDPSLVFFSNGRIA